jgi:ribonuclease P protein component
MSSLKFAPNPHRSSYRLAVVVSKKVHKSAVVRNRIRRRYYEIFRTREGAFTKPYDMIITVFDEKTATIPSAQLQDSVTEQLQKAHIL